MFNVMSMFHVVSMFNVVSMYNVVSMFNVVSMYNVGCQCSTWCQCTMWGNQCGLFNGDEDGDSIPIFNGLCLLAGTSHVMVIDNVC